MSYIGGGNYQESVYKLWSKTLPNSTNKVFGTDDTGKKLSLPAGYSLYQVYVNGIRVIPHEDYRQEGNVLTFTSSLGTGDVVTIEKFGNVSNPSTSSLTTSGGEFSGVLEGTDFIKKTTEEPGEYSLLSRLNSPYVGKNSIIRTNSTIIDEDVEIPVNTNGMSTGTIEIGEGVTVTVSGEWTIV